jgi:hypothetical protein
LTKSTIFDSERVEAREFSAARLLHTEWSFAHGEARFGASASALDLTLLRYAANEARLSLKDARLRLGRTAQPSSSNGARLDGAISTHWGVITTHALVTASLDLAFT